MDRGYFEDVEIGGSLIFKNYLKKNFNDIEIPKIIN